MSKTRLFQSIKALDVETVVAILEKNPDLIRATDDRRRNLLHFLCSRPADPKSSGRVLALARRLLDAGLDVNTPAFVDGAFQATPLWYSISRGRNLPLARLLLKHGSSRDGRSPLDLVRNRRDKTYLTLLSRRPVAPS